MRLGSRFFQGFGEFPGEKQIEIAERAAEGRFNFVPETGAELPHDVDAARNRVRRERWIA